MNKQDNVQLIICNILPLMLSLWTNLNIGFPYNKTQASLPAQSHFRQEMPLNQRESIIFPKPAAGEYNGFKMFPDIVCNI